MTQPVTIIHRNTCDLPLDENPCIEPLLNFHGRIVRLCSTELDPSGKLCDLLVRVLTAAAAPLAYLVLSLIALCGVLLHPCTTSSTIRISTERLNNILPESHNTASVDEEESPYSTINGHSLSQMINAVNRMHTDLDPSSNWQSISAMKLYIQSKGGESSLTTEMLFREQNQVGLDRLQVEEAIGEFLRTASERHRENAEIDFPVSLKVRWAAFLKDAGGSFHCLNGRRSTAGDAIREAEARKMLINASGLEEYAPRILGRMNIPPHRLLDNENNFC